MNDSSQADRSSLSKSTIRKSILKLAIPNLVSNISVPLLSTADVVFMSTLSTVHIGAVGLASMIFNILYWNMGFLRMVTTGLSAQAFGRGNDRELRDILARSANLSWAFSFALMVIAPLIAPYLFKVMEIDTQLGLLVGEYFYLSLLGIPATLMLFSVKGWFFGVQNAFIPLLITVFVNVSNIGLSGVLVLYLDWGIRGVALGTVLAQWIGLVIGLWYLYRQYGIDLKILFRWQSMVEWSHIVPLMRMNLDLFMRTVALSMVFAMLHRQGAAMGPEILAINVVLLQMLNWMSYGIDGFAHAAESLVGKLFGSGHIESLYKTLRQLFQWGFGMAIGYSLVYFLGGYQVFNWFLDDPEELALSKTFLPWLWVLPLVGFVSYLWDGVFAGLTATRQLRDAMLISLIIFLAVLAVTFPTLGNHGVWLALLSFLFTRGAIQTWQFFYRTKFSIERKS